MGFLFIWCFCLMVFGLFGLFGIVVVCCGRVLVYRLWSLMEVVCRVFVFVLCCSWSGLVMLNWFLWMIWMVGGGFIVLCLMVLCWLEFCSWWFWLMLILVMDCGCLVIVGIGCLMMVGLLLFVLMVVIRLC